MINCSNNRRRYIIEQEVPDETNIIEFDVFIDNTLIYSGYNRWFGGDFELDLMDWIEEYWKNNEGNPQDNVRVDFTFTGETTSTATQSFYFDKEKINIEDPVTPECEYFNLELRNSDFKEETVRSDKYDIIIPLKVQNGMLVGKTINNMEKITYIDKHNDQHNSSATNSMELECYIDDEWLKTLTGDDITYTKIMGAAQTARDTTLKGTGRISGIHMTNPTTSLKCRVKDIEKIETHYRYNSGRRIPSLKLVLEIYR